MRYASVCSGVEAATLAWETLGWKPVWFSEVEPFPCKVLAERFGASSPVNPLDPNDASDEKDRRKRANWLKAIRREKMPSVADAKVPNLGDMSKINGKEYHGAIDLLVGGTPCQSFSVAGNGKGLRGVSGLALTYCELLKTMRPKWFVWENVPGVFSTNGGKDFKTLLRTFDEIGYSCAWRVLDAEYVRVDGFPGAVPQRRRRVFVVGYLGDWRPAAKVLFESKVLCGDSAPRRIKGQESSGNSEIRDRQSDALDDGSGTDAEIRSVIETKRGFYRESDVGGTLEAHEDQHRRNIICRATQQANAEMAVNCATTLTEAAGTSGNNQPILCIENGHSAAASAPAVGKSTTLSCDHEAPIIVFHGSQDPISNRDHANAVNRNQGLENCVCFEPGILKREEYGGDSRISEDVCGTLRANTGDNLPTVCLSATDYKETQIICYENHGNDSRITESPGVSPTITSRAGTGGNNLPLVAFGFMSGQGAKAGGLGFCENFSPTIRAEAGGNSIPSVLLKNIGWIVRRITPLEAERLMGFPDYHTRIPWNGKSPKDCPDAPRYKACGNSMCVNVMRWIGTRIDAVKKSIQNGTFEQLFNAEDLE